MWSTTEKFPPTGYLTPQPTWKSRQSRAVAMPLSERKRISPMDKGDRFHVIHKVPAGDSPYVRAKHVQLIEKEPSRAISLFWAAINAGDRVDSALKDMAVVMKQLDRPDEAVEAIISFRHLCPPESQESLDNLLVELYKRSGRIQEEIELLQQKLKNIEEGVAFGGKRTKTARSQGKKIQITVEQEKSRILGNLAWAYLQQHNYGIAEQHYRKALSLEIDKNKQCNLAICLMHMKKISEAKSLLQAVRDSSQDIEMDDSCSKSFERASQMLSEIESQHGQDGMSDQSEENFLGYNKWSSDCRSSGLKASSDNWRKGSYSQNLHDRHIHEKAYGSPASNRRNSGGLLTQPRTRKRSWVFNNGDLKKGRWGENVANSVHKLSFEQAMATEILHSQAGQSVKGELLEATGECINPHSEVPFTQPRSSWGFNNGDHEVGRWGKNVVQNVHSQATQNLKEELPAPADKNLENEQYLEQGSSTTVLGTLKGERFSLNNSDKSDNLHRGFTGKLKSYEEHPLVMAKKSWADIAEEEEKEEKELLSRRNQSKYFDGWRSEEEFNDENMHSNIMYQSPYLQNQMAAAAKELESLDLKDGYCASGSTVSSRSSSVRRSLCFEGYNTDPVNEKDSSSGKNMNMKRRNRLQVFTEIALLSDSP